MENFRRRQRRIAQEQTREEQARLLSDILTIADNLERTLAAVGEEAAIRRGVELTRDELVRILGKYGVERLAVGHEPFDPAWHEAVGVTSANDLGVEPGTVAEVVRAGYRRGERLLRPARVVVAQ